MIIFLNLMQFVEVIATSTNDLGPLSLDSFKKNNLSASWKIVGKDSSDGTSLEVCLAVAIIISKLL